MNDREARCQCCGGYAGHGADPKYCRACIEAGEPPEDWKHPAERGSDESEQGTGGRSRQNNVKLRGYEFEEIVPWSEIIERMKHG